MQTCGGGNIKNWLEVHSLDSIPIYFCRGNRDKLEIGSRLQINVMIDDKSQVLSLFPETVKKLWFNPEKAKIDGATNRGFFLRLRWCETGTKWFNVYRIWGLKKIQRTLSEPPPEVTQLLYYLLRSAVWAAAQFFGGNFN